MADSGQSYPPLPHSVRVGESPSRREERATAALHSDSGGIGGDGKSVNGDSHSISHSNGNASSTIKSTDGVGKNIHNSNDNDGNNNVNNNKIDNNNTMVANNNRPGEEEEEDDGSFTIGEKLEYFYLCLVEKQRKDFPADCELAHIDTHTDTQAETEKEAAIDFDKSLAQSELHYLAHSLALLETHAPIHRLRETRELVEEVAKDVRRKAAAHIRAPYIEPLNALITQCRKRLQTKTALGLQSGGNVEGNDHGQRYLYVLMDLLGSFSDIIRELSLCYFSPPTLQAVLTPLYERVRETCVQSVSSYERDRDILALSQRSCDVNCHLEVSLHSLDAVAAQLGAMKRVLVTHYLFLAQSFAHYFAPHESEGEHVLSDERTTHTSHAHSYPYLDRLLIVSTEEVLHWRELDFLYSTCESNYFLHSIVEACGNNALVEVEENAFLPQAVEDAVFLLYKCVERASLSLDEHTFSAVAHKLLEMLLPPPEFRDNSAKYFRLNSAKESSGGFLWRAMYGEETHIHAQRETETHPALLYALVTESALYRGCCSRRRHALSERALRELVSLCTGRDLPLTDTQTHKVEKALFREEQSSPSKAMPSLTETIQQISTEDIGNIADFAALSAWGEAVSGKVSEGVSNVVSQWWSSYYSTEEDNNRSSEAEHESASRDRNEQFHGKGGDGGSCVTPPRETASEIEREREKLLTTRPQRPSHSHTQTHTQTHTHVQSSSLAHTHTAAAPTTPLRDTQPPTQTEKKLSMEAMLLQALDIREGNDDRERGDDYEEEDEDLFTGNKYSSGSGGIGKGVRGGALRSARDWAVRVNAASALTHAVQWTARTLSSAQDAVFPFCIEKSMSSRAKSKMEGLVKEYRLCCRVYEQWLTDELTHFLLSRRQAHTLRDTLSLFLGRSYVLTGQEMEDRWHNHLLHYCVSLWLAQCPLPPADTHTQPPAHKDTTDAAQDAHTSEHAATITSQDENSSVSACVSWLSLRARRALLRTLSGIIADIVYRECVMQRDFNEWGALLLYEEVQDATKHLENLIQETNTGVDDENERVSETTSDQASVGDENESERNVRRLHWACKLLTLDSPADLRRYNALLDSVLSLFTEGESELRSVLSRRIDFSRDAVKNVPLKFSS